MRSLYLLLFPLFLSTFTSLSAQDTLSFGGIYDLPGAEVRASYTPVSPLAQRFTIEEVYRLPGTFYDPARLVALLPGVVQTNDQANHLSVRGNTPNANLWRLNGLAIVNPNHTANAGTFYDFPTLSGGGVNAISAQMLGNSGFLAGGLPVEYGFATGGTFDLRLRPGSKTRRKYQAQAGFIGFDLMAEGPIGDSGKTSYLVNGRYSFTGLLADMGVDFGGEEIRFADINAHLHHEWDGGELSAFAILGQSSNVFRGPDSTEQEITEQKELFDIDFESGVEIYGLNYAFRPRGRNSFYLGAALSTLTTDRLQQNSFGDIESKARLKTTTTNVSLKWIRKSGDFGKFTYGTEYFRQELSGFARNFFGSVLAFDQSNASIALFGNYEFKNEKFDINFGLRPMIVDFNESASLEPRFQFKYYQEKHILELSTGTNSRFPSAAAAIISPDFPILVPLIKTNYLEIALSKKLGRINSRVTSFFQHTPKDYGVLLDDHTLTSNSFLEIFPSSILASENSTSTPTRRFGLELEAAGGTKENGLYYRSSLTLLRSEAKQLDGQWAKERYSSDYIFKLTLGREWARKNRKKREVTFGINAAFIVHGGERFGEVTPGLSSFTRFFAEQDFTNGFINTTSTYFRPDLRLYKTKTRTKTTTTLALDVQNVANVQNTANVYYDAFLEGPNERFQLGLIPVLSYRIVWR